MQRPAPGEGRLSNPLKGAREEEALSHFRRTRRRVRRGVFAPGNPISQSKDRFLAVPAPGNPQDFSGNGQGWPEAQNLQDSAASSNAKLLRLKLKISDARPGGGDAPRQKGVFDKLAPTPSEDCREVMVMRKTAKIFSGKQEAHRQRSTQGGRAAAFRAGDAERVNILMGFRSGLERPSHANQIRQAGSASAKVNARRPGGRLQGRRRRAREALPVSCPYGVSQRAERPSHANQSYSAARTRPRRSCATRAPSVTKPETSRGK